MLVAVNDSWIDPAVIDWMTIESDHSNRAFPWVLFVKTRDGVHHRHPFQAKERAKENMNALALGHNTNPQEELT